MHDMPIRRTVYSQCSLNASSGLQCLAVSRIAVAAIVVSYAFILSPAIIANDTPEPPNIGDAAPTWTNLVGIDDQKRSLADFAEVDVLIMAFTCNTCPYAVDYEDRLIALHQKYAAMSSSVQLIAINSNAIPADSLSKMKERAAEKKFAFPYLKDDSQTVARAYDAIYTPEFFVLNQQRRIIYRGALDDSTNAQNVDVRFVELAVAAALQGKLPTVSKTGARGCVIRFKRRRR